VTNVGYARVSTKDQDPQLQIDALTKAEVNKIFTEHASGAKTDRPELARALEYLRPGDTLTVWKLDRLGRNLVHLIQVITDLGERDISFVSLTEGFDTRNAMGRMIFMLMGALAEFERELIKERTMAGIQAAAQNGRHGGRPKALKPGQVRQVLRMRDDRVPVQEIASVLGCSRATVYRVLDVA